MISLRITRRYVAEEFAKDNNVYVIQMKLSIVIQKRTSQIS